MSHPVQWIEVTRIQMDSVNYANRTDHCKQEREKTVKDWELYESWK